MLQGFVENAETFLTTEINSMSVDVKVCQNTSSNEVPGSPSNKS